MSIKVIKSIKIERGEPGLQTTNRWELPSHQTTKRPYWQLVSAPMWRLKYSPIIKINKMRRLAQWPEIAQLCWNLSDLNLVKSSVLSPHPFTKTSTNKRLLFFDVVCHLFSRSDMQSGREKRRVCERHGARQRIDCRPQDRCFKSGQQVNANMVNLPDFDAHQGMTNHTDTTVLSPAFQSITVRTNI